MSDVDASKADGPEVIVDGLFLREAVLKEAFGPDKFSTILEFEEATLKVELDHYAYKIQQLAPVYKKRSEFLKTIPGLWLKAITNSRQFATFVDPLDRDALEHLEDLTIEHDPKDPRNITFHFHWSKSNPYFSDRVLSKAYTVANEEQPSTNGESSNSTESSLAKLYEKYDIDRRLSSIPVPINWSSKDHDLVAKKPLVAFTELEDSEEFEGTTGSFFNLFAATDDQFMMHAMLLELHSKVLDLYAGIPEEEDEVESDEEDEEDDDPNKVVELGDDSNDESELPKKKKAKTAAN